MKDQVFINVPEMLGVDADVYERADKGDPQAQKQLLRAMWTQDASPKALASSEPWTYWLLRMVGSGTQQTIADVCGVVDMQRRTGRLPAAQADALDRLVEQFVGPGTVDPPTAALVRQAFPDGVETVVIELFLLHDRLASGDPGVTLPEIELAVQASDQIDSDAARTFFLGVWSQHAAQAGWLDEAIQAAEGALALADGLAAADPEYMHRLGITATLLRQLYGFAGNADGVAWLDQDYREALDALAAEGG